MPTAPAGWARGPGRLGIPAHLLVAVHGDTGRRQPLHDRRQDPVGGVAVDEEGLGGVAHAGALRLGVEDDGERLGDVDVGVHVDVAVAHPGLDDRHEGLAHDRADEVRAATRDEHVDEPTGTHELDGAGAAVGVDGLHQVRGQPLGLQRLPEHLDDETGVVLPLKVEVVEQLGSTAYVHGTLANGDVLVAELRRLGLEAQLTRHSPMGVRVPGAHEDAARAGPRMGAPRPRRPAPAVPPVAETPTGAGRPEPRIEEV